MRNSAQRQRVTYANRRPHNSLLFEIAASVVLILFISVAMTGCASKVSFPSETIPQSIETLCKKHYDMDVAARVSGQTIGVMSYVDRLVDETGKIDQEVIRKTIGDMILTITRVALSTDIKIRFEVVVIRGIQDLNEIRITRNLEDIKKAQTEALSVEESLSRTLWEQSRYRPDIIDPDYFPLQDISMETFFEKQIVQRVRFAAQTKSDDGASFLPSELVEGRFSSSPTGGNVFEFSIVSFESAAPEVNVLKVLRVINDVFKGYDFKGYDLIVIKDLLGRKMLVVDVEMLTQFQQNQLNEDDIMRLGFKDDFSESDRLRNALEMFGFNFQS